MCLSTVESTERKKDASGFGWKVFYQFGKPLRSEFDYGMEGEKRIGKWLVSRDSESENYPIGFHVFTNKKAANRWADETHLVVRRVKWRDRLAIGTTVYDENVLVGKTVVAKEMMILKA